MDVPTATDHYRATRELAAGEEVAARGRDAGAARGDDPAAAVAGIAARVLPLVERRDGSELLTTIADAAAVLLLRAATGRGGLPAGFTVL